MSDSHYDVIVIGSGPGGAAVAQRLAPTGKRILILERGEYLPRSEANWDAETVFVNGRYQAEETWIDSNGSSFAPGLHYWVGGNSKVYGAALFRLRERDFEEVAHAGGISPAWPLRYDEFESYYTQAEALYHVHGARGEDPLEPWTTGPYPCPPVSHEPAIADLAERLTNVGLQPFHLPLGILLDEAEGQPTPTSTCIKCSYFDGFPCLLNGKADAQVISIDPTLALHPNVELLTGAYAARLQTNEAGSAVTGVEIDRGGETVVCSADIVVSACGSLSSALLLLRSANEAHPNGLANGSGLVGRNYMRHNMSVLMAVTKERNPTVFQKTLAFSDFYFGADDWDYPMGLVQLMATSHTQQVKAEALPKWAQSLPDLPFDGIAEHSVGFWLQAEDLPHCDNRVHYNANGQVQLDFVDRNPEALTHLTRKLKQVLNEANLPAVLLTRSLYLGKDIPLSGTSHQAGTARFGTDPATSVLNLDCRAHEVENLYLADASFFPSIGAVNPTLTIVANALRVADRIAERL